MRRQLLILIALAFAWTSNSLGQPEQLKVMPRPLESFKLPPGTIVVVGDSKNPLQNIGAIVLSPDEYKQLLDTIDQLKKQSADDKPDVPSICRLSGRVESRGTQELVKIRATLEFITSRPREPVLLGFRKIAAVAVSMDDGKLPAIQSSDDGFRIIVDTPGRHTVTLDLELPVVAQASKGNERGFSIALPGSPITLIERFDLLPGTTTARLARTAAGATTTAIAQPIAAASLLPTVPNQPALALGPIVALDLTWDPPAAKKPSNPVLTAEGTITVRLDEASSTTVGKLMLKSLGGRVTEWQISAPRGADVAVAASADESWQVTRLDEQSTWSLKIKEPGAESVTVDIVHRQPRTAGPQPVGPFRVLGGMREQGVIQIVTPPNLRPRLSGLRSDVVRRDAEGDAVMALNYGAGSAATAGPWLKIDTEPLRGEVRTQTTHALSFNGTGWRLITTIRATPVRSIVDALEIELPIGLQDVLASPPEIVESLVSRRDQGANRWQVRLAQPKRTEFQIRLEGFFPSRGPATEASFLLPRVLQTFDRDAKVTIEIPERTELRASFREWDRNRPAELAVPIESTGTSNTLTANSIWPIAQIDLVGGRSKSELSVSMVVDLTVDSTSALVRQELTFPPSNVARSIVFQPRAAPPLGGVRATGGTIVDRPGEWTVTLPPSPGKDQLLTLEYISPFQTTKDRPFEPAVLWPTAATRCESRVRVWSVPGSESSILAPNGDAWQAVPLEAVPGRPTWPTMVLVGFGTKLPLGFVRTNQPSPRRNGLFLERCLIAARPNEAGQIEYEARFLLRVGTAASATFEFPVPVSALDLTASVGRRLIDSVAIVNDADRSDAAGRFARIPLPTASSGAVIDLLLTYRLKASRDWYGRWDFQSARPRNVTIVGPTRWWLQLPGDGILLSHPAGATAEQKWGRRRYLPALIPAWSRAELDDWYRAGTTTGDENDLLADTTGTDGTTLLVSSEPITASIIFIPRVAWLIGCSIVVLTVGLSVAALRRRRWIFWLVLTSLPAVVGAAAILRPQIIASFLAAAPPGLIVLAVALIFQWFLMHRYRRRTVFMPGFTRGSTEQRPPRDNSRRSRSDPPTADTPGSGAPSSARKSPSASGS